MTKDWRRISVRDLELSIRSVHALLNANINTLGELVQCTEEWLITEVLNFGRKSLAETHEVLQSIGLKLGMGPDDEPTLQYTDDEAWITACETGKELDLTSAGFSPVQRDEYGGARKEHAVYLRFIERLTYKQIGARLGISDSRARDLVYMGVRRLSYTVWGVCRYGSTTRVVDLPILTLDGD